MSDEQRERMLITEQIERAQAEVQQKSESPEADRPSKEEGLKRDEGEKLVLSINLKPATSSTEPAAGPTLGASGGFKFNALKAPAANPLKRPNVFKMTSAKTSQEKDAENTSKKRSAPMSAAERLIQEEEERKRRRLEREADRSRN